MAKKYLIAPKKKNSLIQKEFFRKGKKFFYIETVWDKPEIVVDKQTNLKNYNPKEGLKLGNFKFKSGESDSKSKLIIPENISNTEAKEIKKQIKNEIPPRAGFLMLDHLISSFRFRFLIPRLVEKRSNNLFITIENPKEINNVIPMIKS